MPRRGAARRVVPVRRMCALTGCVVLCCAVLCCAVLCCAVLCCVGLSCRCADGLWTRLLNPKVQIGTIVAGRMSVAGAHGHGDRTSVIDIFVGVGTIPPAVHRIRVPIKQLT
jgi:hypothetical protein